MEKLDTEEAELRKRLSSHPILTEALALTQDFQRMLRDRKAVEFETWLKACEASKIPEFVNLAQGMKKDKQAIKAALASNWSNGQTEGQINRLKLLKRQMVRRVTHNCIAPSGSQDSEEHLGVS